MQRQPEEKDILALAQITHLDVADPLSIVKLRNLIDLVSGINLKEFNLEKTKSDEKRVSVVQLGHRIKDLRSLAEVNLDLALFTKQDRNDAIRELYYERAYKEALIELKNELRAGEELADQKFHAGIAVRTKMHPDAAAAEYKARKVEIAQQIEERVEQLANSPENQKKLADKTVVRMLDLAKMNNKAVDHRMQSDKLVKTFNEMLARPAADDNHPAPGTSLAELANKVLTTSLMKLEAAEKQRAMFKPRKSKVLMEMERHAGELMRAINTYSALLAKEKYAKKVKSSPATLSAEAVRLSDEEQRHAAFLKMPFKIALLPENAQEYLRVMKDILGITDEQIKALDKVKTSKQYTNDIIEIMKSILDVKESKVLDITAKNHKDISFLDLYVAAINEAILKQAPKGKEEKKSVRTGLDFFTHTAEKNPRKITKSDALKSLLVNAPRLQILAEKILANENPHLMDEARLTAKISKPTPGKSRSHGY